MWFYLCLKRRGAGGAGAPGELSWKFSGLRLQAFTAGGAGSIPGQGSEIPHAMWCSQIFKRGGICILFENIILRNYHMKRNVCLCRGCREGEL